MLLPHLEEAEKDEPKTTEYIEPGIKDGRGRSEDADSELKPAHKRAGTSDEFNAVNPYNFK